MSKQRIWIDVTDLSRWSGHLTGVQRVAYNIARRYADADNYDAKYFRFDALRGQFEERDFSPIRAQIEATQVTATNDVSTEQDPRTWKHMAKALPKAIVRRIPASVKEKVPGDVRRVLRGGYRRGLSLAKKLQAQTPRPAVISEPFVEAQFAKDDVVAILGASWDVPTMLPALGRLKMKRGFKIVHVLYDLVPTYEPHLFPPPGLFDSYTKNLFETAQLCDGLVSISKSSRRDMERFCKQLHIPQLPIGLMRLGDDVIDVPIDNVTISDKRIKDGKYILCVGTLTNRKNIAILYMAYCEAAARGIDLPPLVIVGGAGWLVGDTIYQFETNPKTKDKFIMLRANDAELRWLFEHSRFVIFPAVYEGWGLPVAEALGYGKLCLTGNISSMPEIAGDLIDYFSPYNSGECLDAIVKYLDDKTLRAKEQEIAQKYKKYTWDETYKQFDSFVKKTLAAK